MKGKLYPSIGLKKNGEHIRVNFGQTPFIYDIDGMMEAEIERINRDISATRLVIISYIAALRMLTEAVPPALHHP